MPLEFYATTTAALRKIIKQDTEFPHPRAHKMNNE